MLTFYRARGEALEASSEVPEELTVELAWIDMLHPSAEEEARVEALLGIEVPTREEMREIEHSSRFYQEKGASYITTTLVTKADSEQPETHAVTFILTAGPLVTVRYSEPQSFQNYIARHERYGKCHNGICVMLGLVEAIVDRVADILENCGREIDGMSGTLFRPTAVASSVGSQINFQDMLKRVGHQGDLISKTRESLVGLTRACGYSFPLMGAKSRSTEARRTETILKDLASLSDHASFLSNKITFLLDTTLGMIGIQQNATIKIFSVAAVVFLPPTLIASIYGMNFQHMPELGFRFGYPGAVSIMLLSAYLPYRYFKKKGWL